VHTGECILGFGYKNYFDKEDGDLSIISYKEFELMKKRFGIANSYDLINVFNFCPVCGEKTKINNGTT